MKQDLEAAPPAPAAALESPGPARSRLAGTAAARALVVLLALVATGATVLAMRRTSPTFDEIVLVAGGARGYQTGRFDVAPEHPPFMQYVYGLPVYLSHPVFPRETVGPHPPPAYRYLYARVFYFTAGNDPEKVSFLGRLPAALCVLLLVLATWAFARRRIGTWGGVLAAALVAFLPDVLAHGGVAYNDLPLALAYLLAIWALDVAVRRPDWRSGALAGLAVALCIAVKFSGGGVVLVGLALLALEAAARWREAAWRRQVGVAVLAAAVAGYLALVAVYRGDLPLAEMRYGLDYTLRHVTQGHSANAFLAGDVRPNGWWYFFPVAFLYKTPAALHLLGLLALLGLAAGIKAGRAGQAGAGDAGSRGAFGLLQGPLRPAWVGVGVFAVFLLGSKLDIGFRYALPALVPLCVLVAAGVARLWRQGGRAVPLAVPVLALWYAASTLSFYPNFLSYTSEYGPGRDRGDELLLDSSLDWGQGLIQLRDWMREERVPRVYLAYFGSSLPGAYGIDYLPLRSFPTLLRPRPPRPGEPDPQYAVISATLLHPVYFRDDPYRRFREIRPYRVLAHSLFVYRLHD